MGRYPQLGKLCEITSHLPRLELWIFGSALSTDNPHDLDLLLIYEDLDDAKFIRSCDWWEDYDPPIDLIAMTPEEEAEYRFIKVTRAQRLV